MRFLGEYPATYKYQSAHHIEEMYYKNENRLARPLKIAFLPITFYKISLRIIKCIGKSVVSD